MMTNTHTELVPRSLPLALNPFQISGFHVFYTHTRARLHTPRMSLLSDALLSERLARPAPSSLVLLSAAPCPCQSVTQSFQWGLRYAGGIQDLDDHDRGGCSSLSLPSPYLIINHCSEASVSLLSHHFALSDASRKAPALHSQVEMTGVALVGRRWADRLCRDRTVTFLVF